MWTGFSEARSFLRGIDMNRRPPSTADCEEEVGVSSPNSTISSVSGKRSEREEMEAGDRGGRRRRDGEEEAEAVEGAVGGSGRDVQGAEHP